MILRLIASAATQRNTAICALVLLWASATQPMLVGCAVTKERADRNVYGVDVSQKTPRKSYVELKGIAFAAFQEFLTQEAEPYEGLPRQYYDESDLAFHVFFDGYPDDEHFRFIFSVAAYVGDGAYHVIVERRTGKILEVGVGR